ncbi:condensation-domain-containing protein, partial [Colletotrichum falcatum]
MQSLFFRLSPDGCSHFNQSLLLRLSEGVTVPALEQALRGLVARHDALRARFQPGNAGWQQSFAPDVSLALGVCDIADDAQLKKEVSRAQQSLDIRKGAVFSSRVLRRPGGDSLLFLVAHHLVIDLFSWRVLVDDLQALLSGKTPAPVPLSWPSFCRLQARELSTRGTGAGPSTGDVPDFWDVRDEPNLFSDTVSSSAVLDEALTELFLAGSNRALGTEPVEVLTSSLLVSFLETFQERTEARVFLEGHGRDVLDADASQTVGWFTTLLPLSLDRCGSAGTADALVRGLRRIKDRRRRTARESVVATARSLSEGDLSLPVEILMNYQGTATWAPGQEEGGGLLGAAATDLPDVSDHDIGPDMPRIALFEILAAVQGGRLRISMQHNRRMRRQDRIDDWFRLWIDTLTSGLPALAALEPSPTLVDFPLLPSGDYAGLDRLGRVELPSRNLSFADVQDILPCSTVQEGILVSQSRGVGEYVVRAAWEVHGAVTPDQLERAWSAVVQRHDSLRTIFLESASSFVQLVLKTPRLTGVHRAVLERGDEIRNLASLAAPPPSYDASPPHCLSIMTAPWDGLERSRTFIILAINHAIIDGDSMDVLLREMQLACSGTLEPGLGPSYSSFIARQMASRAASAEYWNKSLQNATPTRFPGRRAERGAEHVPRSAPSHVEADVDFSAGLQAFCRRAGVTVSDVSHVAWAVVLGLYTGCRTPVFGYLFSGRQGGELPEVQDAVGVYISMLVARVPLDGPGLSVGEAVAAAHDSVIRDIQHAHCSLADLQHRAGEPLFNTGISVR